MTMDTLSIHTNERHQQAASDAADNQSEKEALNPLFHSCTPFEKLFVMVVSRCYNIDMKPMIALFIALLFYVRADILIWQRIFETNELWWYDWIYHKGWFTMLYGFIVLGVFFLNTWRERCFYGVSLYLCAFNGTVDVLYYWLDGRSLPQRLEWLDTHRFILFSPVTDVSLLLNCFLWLLFLVLLFFGLLHAERGIVNIRQFLYPSVQQSTQNN